MGFRYQRIIQFGRDRISFILWVALLALFLSGCVRYDVGVTFKGQFAGTITQHITLGEQLTRFSGQETSQWLKSIEKRAKKLGGKVKHPSKEEVLLTIPFGNGKEFVNKFNQFFNPTELNPEQLANQDDLVALQSQLTLNQSNFILWERDRLNLDVDLRGLAVFEGDSSVIIEAADSLYQLDFTLKTPWGAQNIKTKNSPFAPPLQQKGNKLIWQLEPGQVNHISAVFWVPSFLGLGTVSIVLLMFAGYWAKYRLRK